MVNLGKNKVPCDFAPMISLSLLSFLLQLLLTLQVNSYEPADDLAVNCGDSGNSSFKGRNWVGDVDSKLFSTIEPKTGQPSTVAVAPNSPSVDTVPFGTARLFHSEFTYSFHVTNGPKFVRLHFYPTSYGNFEPNKSLFSVKVANFTLLKGFNASLWVNKGEETFFVEYCINVETGQTLNITFLPNTNHPNSYAFINGIEVVSMPLFLYYTNLSIDTGFEMVGHGNTYQIDNSKALQTLYRLNVGGSQIQPSSDTGMFRNWESDDPYLEEEHPHSISNYYGDKGILKYKSNVQNYTAPADVYLTARSYGMYETANYNVTWEFEVDSEFIYMVRLHFCEFDSKVQHYGDRTFQIFIADTLAEENADVIGWSGGNLVPVYKDYAVLMPSEGISKKVKLSIKLQRLPNNVTNYHDVILNGIEILKISDDNNLAGPNPEPVPSRPEDLQPSTPSTKSSKKKTMVVIIIAVVAVSCLVLASVMSIIVFGRRKRGLDKDKNSRKIKTEG